MTEGRFGDLGFDDFRRLAGDGSLSRYERIGFPDAYREGFEAAIFADIRKKLDLLDSHQRTVLDIGPGCSELPQMLIQLCQQRSHKLWLIDSKEMLAHLPDGRGIEKVAAMYPQCPEFLAEHRSKIDVILCYSVLHYILVDVGFFRFLDQSLDLLAPGGQFLIGDIPNISKRNRFFASATGRKFHREFMKTEEDIEVNFNRVEHDKIDDSVVMVVLQRARQAGFDAYVMPQGADLPMANRREDILITRP